MSKSQIKDYRNATASWSWYLHQWKVGIFVALKEINRLLWEWKTEDDLKNWRIIYENAEDFDIQEKDETWVIEEDNDWTLIKWRVESRHQVKAKKSWNTQAKYNDVLWIQSHEISDTSLKIKNPWFQIRSFKIDDTKKNIIEWNIEVDENSRFLHTIVEVTDFKRKNENLSKKPDMNHYSNNPNNVELFEYPNWNKYIELSTENEELREESYTLIKQIRTDLTDSENDKNVYLKILSELDKRIRDEHSSNPIWYPELSFYEIKEIINNYTTFTEIDNIKLRRRFVEYYDDFLSWVSDDELLNISDLMWEIVKLDIDKFIWIIHEIHPEKKYSENWFDLNDDWLDEVFFECLAKIDNSKYKKFNFFIENEEIYFLSTINKKKAKIKKVVNWIISNSKITNSIYESDYLINGYINDIKFSDHVKNYWGFEMEKEKIDTESSVYSWECRSENLKDNINNSNLVFITADNTINKFNPN